MKKITKRLIPFAIVFAMVFAFFAVTTYALRCPVCPSDTTAIICLKTSPCSNSDIDRVSHLFGFFQYCEYEKHNHPSNGKCARCGYLSQPTLNHNADINHNNENCDWIPNNPSGHPCDVWYA